MAVKYIDPTGQERNFSTLPTRAEEFNLEQQRDQRERLLSSAAGVMANAGAMPVEQVRAAVQARSEFIPPSQPEQIMPEPIETINTEPVTYTPVNNTPEGRRVEATLAARNQEKVLAGAVKKAAEQTAFYGETAPEQSERIIGGINEFTTDQELLRKSHDIFMQPERLKQPATAGENLEMYRLARAAQGALGPEAMTKAQEELKRRQIVSPTNAIVGMTSTMQKMKQMQEILDSGILPPQERRQLEQDQKRVLDVLTSHRNELRETHKTKQFERREDAITREHEASATYKEKINAKIESETAAFEILMGQAGFSGEFGAVPAGEKATPATHDSVMKAGTVKEVPSDVWRKLRNLAVMNNLPENITWNLENAGLALSYGSPLNFARRIGIEYPENQVIIDNKIAAEYGREMSDLSLSTNPEDALDKIIQISGVKPSDAKYANTVATFARGLLSRYEMQGNIALKETQDYFRNHDMDNKVEMIRQIQQLAQIAQTPEGFKAALNSQLKLAQRQLSILPSFAGTSMADRAKIKEMEIRKKMIGDAATEGEKNLDDFAGVVFTQLAAQNHDDPERLNYLNRNWTNWKTNKGNVDPDLINYVQTLASYYAKGAKSATLEEQKNKKEFLGKVQMSDPAALSLGPDDVARISYTKFGSPDIYGGYIALEPAWNKEELIGVIASVKDTDKLFKSYGIEPNSTKKVLPFDAERKRVLGLPVMAQGELNTITHADVAGNRLPVSPTMMDKDGTRKIKPGLYTAAFHLTFDPGASNMTADQRADMVDMLRSGYTDFSNSSEALRAPIFYMKNQLNHPPDFKNEPEVIKRFTTNSPLYDVTFENPAIDKNIDTIFSRGGPLSVGMGETFRANIHPLISEAAAEAISSANPGMSISDPSFTRAISPLILPTDESSKQRENMIKVLDTYMNDKTAPTAETNFAKSWFAIADKVGKTDPALAEEYKKRAYILLYDSAKRSTEASLKVAAADSARIANTSMDELNAVLTGKGIIQEPVSSPLDLVDILGNRRGGFVVGALQLHDIAWVADRLSAKREDIMGGIENATQKLLALNVDPERVLLENPQLKEDMDLIRDISITSFLLRDLVGQSWPVQGITETGRTVAKPWKPLYRGALEIENLHPWMNPVKATQKNISEYAQKILREARQ